MALGLFVLGMNKWWPLAVLALVGAGVYWMVSFGAKACGHPDISWRELFSRSAWSRNLPGFQGDLIWYWTMAFLGLVLAAVGIIFLVGLMISD